jgi:uncharacterized protein (UPF0335 family)
MEEWEMSDLIEVKNDWKKLAQEQAEKIERYENALKEIADEYAFDDVYDEVTTKRFIAKQALNFTKSK